MGSEDKQPSSPDEWRELLRSTTYDYPEDAYSGTRRERRRARQAARQAERQHTKEWIAAERRRDPITPGGAILVIVAILGLGLAVKYLLPQWTDSGQSVKATASPSASALPPAGKAPAPIPASASPSASVDLSQPNAVADAWARAYLTRNPPLDGDHTASIARAADFMTQALEANLSNSPDPGWTQLVSEGAVATVTGVKVSQAGGGLPPDTPLRMWRQLTVTLTVTVQGAPSSTQIKSLQAEVSRTGNGWLVSRVLGV
jgi:hypothetical protein